ncbi:MAG: phosphohistidine phosphatase SixA [Spirochaetia bacterium]|jgi:phosphohistidine phosphatase|nr:phosphohistidine phosphatase SixA [Spirochaetia bacterium]
MKLYLIQHALSISKEEDPERGISDAGRVETERVAEYFKKLDPDIHVIWQSGKKRARETAEIFAKVLGIDNRILEHSNLLPNDPVVPHIAVLEKMYKNIVIVGHLPFLPRLLSQLTSGSDSCQSVNFNNSGIICLEKDKDQWKINWITIPANVR